MGPEPLTGLLSQDQVICNGVSDTNQDFPPSGAIFPQQSTQAQSYMNLPQGEYIAVNCVTVMPFVFISCVLVSYCKMSVDKNIAHQLGLNEYYIFVHAYNCKLVYIYLVFI